MEKPKIKSLALLLAELILIASSATWPHIEQESYLPIITYTALLFLGGYVLASSRLWVITYILLSLVVIVTTFNHYWLAESVNILTITVIYGMLFCQVFKHSFIKRGVSRMDQILSGIVGYLLLGLFWALQYRWLDLFDTSGIKNTLTQLPIDAADQLYFSFVTLTTLGYGEILPVSSLAKLLVMLTAITGTLYLAVFIACIIGRREEARDIHES